MYSRILIASDGSELAMRGLDHGLSLAKLTGAELAAVTVTEPSARWGIAREATWGGTADILAKFQEAVEEHARQVLGKCLDRAEKAGIRCKTVHVPESNVAEGVVHTARNLGSNLIVMGSHGRRGIGRLLLGSQAAEVLSLSYVPVLIVK